MTDKTHKEIPAVRERKDPTHPIVMRVQRVLARVKKKGHPLDGRMVEVTGRRPGEVAVTGLFGGEETWLGFEEVAEVKRG